MNLVSRVFFPLNAPTTSVSNEIADITKDKYCSRKREEGKDSETGEWTSVLLGGPSLPSSRPQDRESSEHRGQALPVVCVRFQLGFVRMLL